MFDLFTYFVLGIWCETALMGGNNTGDVAHTGYSFLQVKFDGCPTSYKPLAGKSYGIVCQYNSTWSQPSPSCPDDSHLLTPEKLPNDNNH